MDSQADDQGMISGNSDVMVAERPGEVLCVPRMEHSIVTATFDSSKARNASVTEPSRLAGSWTGYEHSQLCSLGWEVARVWFCFFVP
uniref:Uncharacterized protein n=1 Tax=Piliocolobus tephrosceles TaxID=591936 RepID=A0A8C9IUL4_9PRIM